MVSIVSRTGSYHTSPRMPGQDMEVPAAMDYRISCHTVVVLEYVERNVILGVAPAYRLFLLGSDGWMNILALSRLLSA